MPDLTGEILYSAYRNSMQRAAKVRGLSPEPRWKDLKPWKKNIWNRAANSLGEQKR
jgi:hypothetical protein